MKNLKIIALLLFLSFKSYGQLIVHDNAAIVEAIKHSEQAIKQTKEIEKQSKFAEQAIEKLEKVNSALSNAKLVFGIKKNLEYSFKILIHIPKLISTIKEPALKNKLLEDFQSINLDMSIIQELLKSSITSNVFRMSDAERLNTLSSLYDKSKNIKSDILYFYNKVSNITRYN